MVAPDQATLRHYRRRQKEMMRVRAARGALRKTPAVTGDGETVNLQANVEFHSELTAAIRDGATGVGLYRTEYLFLNRRDPEAEQHEAYSGIVRAARGGPVTIRTLDLGADKQIDGARPVPRYRRTRRSACVRSGSASRSPASSSRSFARS